MKTFLIEVFLIESVISFSFFSILKKYFLLLFTICKYLVASLPALFIIAASHIGII